MQRDSSPKVKFALDWLTIGYYLILVSIGWISIYGASFDLENTTSIFDFGQRAGKQFVWILTALGLGGMLLLVEYRMYNMFAYVVYGAVILLLILTIFIAPDIKGSRSWLVLGPVSFQPAELAKVATSLALAKFMSTYNYKLKTWKDMLPLLMFVFIPFALIILQKETGSALVFVAFFLVFYREGMSGVFLLLGVLAVILFVVVIRFGEVILPGESGNLGVLLAMGIILLTQVIYAYFIKRNRRESIWLLSGILIVVIISVVLWKFGLPVNFNYVSMAVVFASCVYWALIQFLLRYKTYSLVALFSLSFLLFSFSADYLFDSVLQPHQQMRIKVLLNMENDPSGVGYNVNQSKIAIGSGGLLGKGFLNGTQTKLKYVPEQDTDFIFCTVGEEHGFLGSLFVLLIYWLLLMRILTIAERQREAFSRIYGYCVASIFFMHLMINIGMVLGLMPVIGIPLPFFSYGGSSLWAFTILLFILLRLDASRFEMMR